jgi:hypothetical protein
MRGAKLFLSEEKVAGGMPSVPARMVPTTSVNVPASRNDEAEQVIDHGVLLEGFDGDRRLINQIVLRKSRKRSIAAMPMLWREQHTH